MSTQSAQRTLTGYELLLALSTISMLPDTLPITARYLATTRVLTQTSSFEHSAAPACPINLASMHLLTHHSYLLWLWSLTALLLLHSKADFDPSDPLRADPDERAHRPKQWVRLLSTSWPNLYHMFCCRVHRVFSIPSLALLSVP